MATISMMTSLNNPDQRGGAFLRVDAIRRIYEDLGFQTQLHYHDQFKTKHSISSLIKSLGYSKKARIMFRTSKQQIPDGDFLHLDNLRHFSWKHNSSLPILFNAHNLEYENYFNRNESQECEKFRSYEFNQMAKAKCIWLCSQREKNILNQALPETTAKSFVIPNLVDKNHYYSSQKKYISFIGTLDYYPNILAVDYILEELLPSLDQEDLDGLEVVIAGRNPTESQINKCKEKNVTLRTNLSQEDILKLFAETKILLVPLVEGSGTRLKILEGIFSNSYILSTPMGAEGIESQNITLAELNEFKNKLLELIKETKEADFKIENQFLNSFDIDSWIKINRDKILGAITK
jgi:hypothetical protein